MYEQLFGRNFPLISEEEQRMIKNLKIAIVGLGALSFAAEYLVRMGVENFVLVDGDKVEVVNMNHQKYTLDDIRKNKAKALAESLLKINPEIKVTALPTFLLEQNFDEIWNNYLFNIDIIIDGIDPIPGILVSRKLAQKCKEQNIIYLYPLDLGNGTLVITNAEKFLNLLNGDEPLEMLMKMIQKVVISIPTRNEAIFEKLMKRELEYYPQTVIAAVTASVITAAVVLQIIQEKKVPSIIYCDFTT
jgi:hypothetical protein